MDLWRSLAPVAGTAYLHVSNRGKGDKTVSFEIKVAQPGDYEMKLLYVANPNRSSKTPVTASLDGGVDKGILVDQRKRDGAGKSPET